MNAYAAAALDEELQLEEELALEAARTSFEGFVRYLNPDHHISWHHRLICAELERLVTGDNKRLVVTCPPRVGKACADSTPIWTPNGWTTHGQLKVGSYVFGGDGTPRRVVAVSEPCVVNHEVRFTNGDAVHCHAAHDWTLFDRGSRIWRTVETGNLAQVKTWSGPVGKRGGRARFQLPGRPVLHTEPVNLPLDPYVFGAWLGDGTTGCPKITHHVDDRAVIDAIVLAGFKVSVVHTHKTTGVISTVFAGAQYRGGRGAGRRGSPLQRALRATGAYNSKHIPDIYLQAGTEQRRQLLAGLIDTDGSVDGPTGRCCYSTTLPAMAEQVAHLARTLGARAYVCKTEPCLSSSGIQGKLPVYQVSFHLPCPVPCRLPRKQAQKPGRIRAVGVRSVTRVKPQTGRCIQVASDDGIYLVGRQMIPTHNSELISRHFPAYLMGINPNESIIATSYATPLAQRMSRDVQRIMDSAEYARVFPNTQLWGKNVRSVADGSYLRNSDIFEVVNHRGVYRAAGLGAGVTGMGGHYLFIDDNIKDAATAMSQTILDNQWEWYSSTFRTRLAKGGRIAIVATRWSFDDIIGRLLRLAEEHPNADQWRVVNLPAIKESPPTEDDPRQPGEALWPEFFPLKEMETLRATNSRQFEALYQCNPVPLGGNLVQDTWWREYQQAELPRRFDKVIIACDLTFKDTQQGDWTVLVAMGLHQGRCYVLDMVRRQIAFTAQKTAILDLVERTNATYGHVREVVVEDAANGAAIVDTLRVHLPNVIAVPASGASKYARASAITPIIEAGNVLLPCPTRTAWVQTLRVEWAQFPMARHDDCVDATVHGLARLFPPRISMAGALPMGLRKQPMGPLFR